MEGKENANQRDNPMKAIRINKLVVNIGTGNDDKKQANAKKLLELITGASPSDAISKKRIPSFKISVGAKIGAFVTLRNKAAYDTAKRLFEAVDNKLSEKNVEANTVNFGIKEYIDISGVKYDPTIGMMGMNIDVSFKRPGLRTELRKRARAKVKRLHRQIGREELKEYLGKEFGIKIEGASQ
ncbi:50S ribosomal protein L5 [Candidatus Marsarchaeota archaeon]|nr:50S ribosomal protein L5 [Candidatus Marsarchaeota archaeon]MCL5404541.1 50S ribosomal protein L5 [Candidatus Marsarchaeota archaeon]